MPESKLIGDLLKKYDEMVRPVERVRNNVTVHFSLALNQIISLDDTSGQLDSRVTLRMVGSGFSVELEFCPRPAVRDGERERERQTDRQSSFDVESCKRATFTL